MITVNDISVQFGGTTLFSEVSFAINENDKIALMGKNGAGKSTLLKIIFGVVSADFKFVRIDGKVQLKAAALFRDISYLHQDSCIPKSLSVKKAIQLSIPKEELLDFYADEMIHNIRDKKTRHLSGGELRYLEIKLALRNPSKFVLLDEPYSGLSPLMGEKINQLILDNSARKGIIITDHNYQNVISVATQLTLMKEGKLHYLKDKIELVEKGYLNSEML